ncbi:MAG: diguanylate cyclase [Actinomycetota bacterium]
MSAKLVLLVEDSLVVRTVVRQHLTEEGYRVVEVNDGTGAMSAMHEHRPDVVLMDIEMPVMDGFQILEAIKADPQLCDTPVVFLTASEGTDHLVRALQRGAHDYLRKPFEAPELIARVRAAVRVKALQDELRVRNAELELLAGTDALTGLWNRRHMQDELQTAVSAAGRHGHPLSVFMVDIDHFKVVNDEHGHPAGDIVLHWVADRIRRAVRTEDVAGRWGGEEFLAVLPWTGWDGATTVAERLRASIAKDPVSDAGVAIPVTVSIGVATAYPGERVDEIVARADRALYRAKERGRNRVEGDEEVATSR